MSRSKSPSLLGASCRLCPRPGLPPPWRGSLQLIWFLDPSWHSMCAFLRIVNQLYAYPQALLQHTSQPQWKNSICSWSESVNAANLPHNAGVSSTQQFTQNGYIVRPLVKAEGGHAIAALCSRCSTERGLKLISTSDEVPAVVPHLPELFSRRASHAPPLVIRQPDQLPVPNLQDTLSWRSRDTSKPND